MGEFGKFISKKRKEKGVSLRVMAKELNISISYLSDLEQGNKLPPNSSNERYKELISNIIKYFNMDSEDKERCLNYADDDLAKNGHISNDLTDYIGQTPLASVALRKAKNLNYSDEDWKKIIENFEKK